MNGCPVCGGQLALLGQLGQRVHFRCTGCGVDSSAEASEVEVSDETPEHDGAADGGES